MHTLEEEQELVHVRSVIARHAEELGENPDSTYFVAHTGERFTEILAGVGTMERQEAQC
jgi:hypothetical protein